MRSLDLPSPIPVPPDSKPRPPLDPRDGPLRRFAIDPVALRQAILTAAPAGARPDAAEAGLAVDLSRGVPAAWALFQDAVRPHLEVAAAALGADAGAVDRAVAILYRERASVFALPPGAGKGADFDLLLLCRTALHRAVSGDASPAALSSGEAALPSALRAERLPPLLARSRDGEQQLPRDTGTRLLNLPAALVLMFTLLMVPVLLWLAEQPPVDRDTMAREAVLQMLRAGDFDGACRALIQSPPRGLEGLRPVWPEQRRQRLRDLAAGAAAEPVSIIGPRGPIDSVRPKVVVQVAVPRGRVRFLVRDAALGVAIYDEMHPAAARLEVDLGADLQRGGTYTIAATLVDSSRAEQRVVCHVLDEAERTDVEQAIGRLAGVVGDPALQPYFAAHCYRARGCLEASLEAWKLLREQLPAHSYAREEYALVLEDLGRLPEARALAVLSRREP